MVVEAATNLLFVCFFYYWNQRILENKKNAINQYYTWYPRHTTDTTRTITEKKKGRVLCNP